MLTPLAMRHVNFYLPREKSQAVALELASRGIFHPVPARDTADLPDRPADEHRKAFHAARQTLDRTMSYLGLSWPERPESLRVVTADELRQLGERLQPIWRECAANEARQRHLAQEGKRIAQLQAVLRHYRNLDADLGLLQSRLRFLDVRIGTLPTRSLARLQRAFTGELLALQVYLRSEDTVHVTLAALAGREKHMDDVLRAASFRPLELPAEFRDRPEQVHRELAERAGALEDERADLCRNIARLREQRQEFLYAAAQTIVLAAPYAALAEAVAGRGELVHLAGWVPKKRFKALEAALRRIEAEVVWETRRPERCEWTHVPSATRYPQWLTPFAQLVRNYGIPRYGEIDPTWLFMATFVAMYGMMFGDVGHGLVIAAAGLLFRARLRGYAVFVVASGIASAVFGLVYGSVFGYEQLLPALWHSPLSAPMSLLKIAMAVGVIFIIAATVVTVRNQLIGGLWREALFDGTGVAGLALYALVIALAYYAFSEGLPHPLWLSSALLPLASIVGFQWLTSSGPRAERVLVTFIQTYEAIVGYLVNTLSFLRLAAFALNHAALVLAVFTLAKMVSGSGSVLVIILGNLVILTLEGGIVAIQAMRLEYYEGFSRFFNGDGHPYQPLIFNPSGRAQA